MNNKSEILQLLTLYNVQFPDEVDGVRLFTGYMERTAPEALITRKNFDGHITASAFIIDSNLSEMLMLRHKSLGKWLQPGGHIEPTDQSIVHAALREAVEETGIAAHELTHHISGHRAEVPFDIDSHYIPANPKKFEDGHYHHDLRYLFIYRGNKNNQYNTEESTGLKWIPFSELESDTIFAGVVQKIKKHFDNK